MELVDPELGPEYSPEEAKMMLTVALMCTNSAPTLRPTMSQVVSMLEGQTAVQDVVSDPRFSSGDSGFKAIRNHFLESQSVSHSLTISTGAYSADSFMWNTDREENPTVQTNDQNC